MEQCALMFPPISHRYYRGILIHFKKLMQEHPIDTAGKHEIMTPEEVARYLRKSTSWVYKNWKGLGGRKLGGSLFFPNKENLYEHIFCQRQGVEVRFHPEGREAHRGVVHHEKRGKNCGNAQKGGDTGKQDGKDPNRHKILGFGEQET